MSEPSLRFFATVYALVPETRWFRRYVLRRDYRRDVLHTGPVESFNSYRGPTGTRTELVVADVLDHLLFTDAS